jgi:hypothetical protein
MKYHYMKFGIWAPLCFVVAAEAQNVSLRGRVVDSASHALSGVEVKLKGLGMVDTTDAAGAFAFRKATTGASDGRIDGGLRVRYSAGWLELAGARADRVSIIDQNGKTADRFPGTATRILLGEEYSNGRFILVIRYGNGYRACYALVNGSLARLFQDGTQPLALGKAAGVADTLAFSKKGYLSTEMALSSLSDSLPDLVLRPVRPLPPESLTVSAVSPHSLRLKWSGIADTSCSILVQRSLSQTDGFLAVGETPCKERTLLDSGLAEGTEYFYRLFTKSSLAVSIPTAAVSAKTGLVPGYALTLAANPTAGGTVSAQPSLSVYPAGASVIVKAVPAANYVFLNWNGSGSASDSSRTIVVNKDTVLTANFAQIPVLTAPATVGDTFEMQATYVWPALGTTNDRYEFASSSLRDSGFTTFFKSPDNDRTSPMKITVWYNPGTAAGDYYYRVRILSNGSFSPWSRPVKVSYAPPSIRTAYFLPAYDNAMMKSSADATVETNTYQVAELGIGNQFFGGPYLYDYTLIQSAAIFNLTGLSGKKIKKAELVLYPRVLAVEPGSADYTVAAFAGAWSPSSLTFNNQPNYFLEGQAHFAVPVTSVLPTVIDVTTIVQNWVSGTPNNGFLFWDNNIDGYGTNSNRTTYFNSMDWYSSADKRPGLSVEYSD